jgi:hypothetical protein
MTPGWHWHTRQNWFSPTVFPNGFGGPGSYDLPGRYATNTAAWDAAHRHITTTRAARKQVILRFWKACRKAMKAKG